MSQHFQETPRSQASRGEAPYRHNEHLLMGNYSSVLPSVSPTHKMTNLYGKELSVRSISTHKKSHRSKISQPTAYENDYEFSRVSETPQNNYEAIERILKNQNWNLKKQNELLLSQIQRLKASSRKYKDNCLDQRIELQALKEECAAQKKRADEMKEIIMNRLVSLQSKALGTTEGLSVEEREDLLHALSQGDNSNQAQPDA